MDDLEDRGKRVRNDFEKGSISDGFSSTSSKLQNSSTIHSQATMYKFNLAAALHDHAYDHISCTKLQPDLSRTEDGLITLSLSKENEKQPNFHQSQDHDDTFKDIILVQLDLIQHQQEQLLKKERQLQQARQDSESLYKRLESMEKEIASLREQLSRKEENRLGNRGGDFLEVNRDDCLDSQLTFTNFLTDLPSTADHQQTAAVSKSVELSEQQANTIELASTVPIRKGEDKKRKKTASRPDQPELNKEDKKSITGSKRKKSKDKSTIIDEQRPDSPQAAVHEHHQHLRFPYQTIETDNPYEIVTNKDFFNALEDDDELDSLHRDEHPSKSEQIEIPSWRLHPISCSYSLEGTENLNDEVFRHRHSKFEMDEKRRKRWDLQRLRESHYNERLRSRYSSTSKAIPSNSGNVNLNSSSTSSQAPVNSDNNSNDVSSFYPSPNILKYIEVSERLPVVAFGHCIPDLPAKDFTLPWSSSNNSNSSKAPATNPVKAVSKKNPL